MPRSGKLLVLFSLIALAAWLHLSICTWGTYKDSAGGAAQYTPLIARGAHFLMGRGTGVVDAFDGTGLFARPGIDPASASFFGMALPFGLVVTAVVLVLYWRQQARVARGACPRCGHIVAAPVGPRCPECGLQVAHS